MSSRHGVLRLLVAALAFCVGNMFQIVLRDGGTVGAIATAAMMVLVVGVSLLSWESAK